MVHITQVLLASFSVQQKLEPSHPEFLYPLFMVIRTYQQQAAAQRRMVASKKLMKVGPWGGSGGTPWDDGGHTGIRSITMCYDHRCVDSIAVEYDQSGIPVHGDRHGGAGGNQTTQVKLRFPDEHLTAVSGRYGPVAQGGAAVIRSLAFRTDRAAYGPFGAGPTADGGTTPFEFAVDGGVIVGFCGRSGWQLDAVGVYLAALTPETVYHKVHKLGLMAYRKVMHRLGPPAAAAAEGQEEDGKAAAQVQQQNGGSVQANRK
ncbi:jacalin-related lectin 19 isoform X2 [Brachypodium distachyon]|uniref:Jacalin-type lectin domain-containing protein n=1 Tax=Brachypodium distachyon TaxID=15368 RepID=A0A0Q3G3M6_BRADI|nr:jacalin-related lectin 19 isoform X2 [Brachypodium distachyon]KQK05125.1 hypothetical protein BRADI_2g18160v3 [Brachypodium distachyon]|eukprot:XP_010231088.1 jacalin-related lectin 19 isoform X2 [Brachypodium distachyon]